MRKEDPYLDAALKGWLVNTARKHYWRVSSWMDMDDLIQEGYFCFAKCKAKFKFLMDEPDVDNRKQFMAFFKMAFMNRITDISKDRTDTPEVAVANLPDYQADLVETWTSSANEEGDAPLAALIAKAPAEIAEMFRRILVDGAANVPYLKTNWRKKFLPGCPIPRIVKARRQVRETTREHYDRCLGETDVVEKLREYILREGDDVLIDRLVRSLFSQ